MLRYVYLGLAVWGTIHPMMWFFTWFKSHDYSLAKLPRMLDAWHVNPATSGLVWDLTIAAIALTVGGGGNGPASGRAAFAGNPCNLLHWPKLRFALAPISAQLALI